MPIICHTCKKSFDSGNWKRDKNSLYQHLRSHHPRNTHCPICIDKRFQDVAGATQHVESGACRKCPGKEEARRKIFEFFKEHEITRKFLKSQAVMYINTLLEVEEPPDFPYECKICEIEYRDASSLMQHLAQKHYNTRALRGISIIRMLQ